MWTVVDIRYIGHNLAEENKLYCISVLENHSRALLASAALTAARALRRYSGGW